ncbi:MAG: penicillin-binding protein 2 [Alphaproteobacteria bacterium]
MQRDFVRYKAFTRRAALLGGGQLVLVSALAGRMYYLQVLQSDHYAMLADENRISLRLVPPVRGHIVDRHGRPMAVNRINYRVVIVPEQTPDVEGTLDAFSAIVPVGDHSRQRILREISRKRPFVPVTIHENLNWEEVARIEVNAPDLPGVMIDVGQTRHYPPVDSVAHVLGYVAPVAESELTGNPLLELPGFRIGKSGIEKTYDLALRGKGGTSQVEVNAVGRVIREISRDPGRPGQDLALTLDLELQKYAIERLGPEAGAVVVIDVHAGDILAMASTPGFDPNAFNRGLTQRQWRRLVSDPRGPLHNKAISGQYAPGSTFKMMVALAGLESGIVSQYHRVFCRGYITLGNARFHCWKRGGHGWMSMVPGITQSCDVYFYDVARRVGIHRIADMATRFGYGKALGIDLPGEKDGLMPTAEWKLATIDEPWQQGETLVTGIGQGYVLATPLQLATVEARLVNGGRLVIPHLARDIVKPGEAAPRPEPEFPAIEVSEASLAVVTKAMKAVVNSPRGTAYRSRISEPDMAMGGKTGTSQVRRITKSERLAGIRKNEDKPWEERDHALFLGYAPVDAPRYAVAVVVEHGGGGSKMAAPIARDVLLETQRRAPAAALARVPGRAPVSRAEG